MGGTYTIKLGMRTHIQFMLGHRTCGFLFFKISFFLFVFKWRIQNVHSQTFPRFPFCHTELLVLSERVLRFYTEDTMVNMRK